MSAGWVAAGVRGRALLRRRLGHDGARRLAALPSLASALSMLADTAYGRAVRPGQDLEAAQHAVSATALWHMRVLAGWGPPLGAGPLRVLGGAYEIANVTGRLLELSGSSARPPYALGSLATAWPAVVVARSPNEVRAALRSSPWGDPGSEELPVIRLALQLAWARRVYDGVPGAADWALTGAALLLGRVLTNGSHATLGPSARLDAGHMLGGGWERAGSLEELRRHVPHVAARALDDVGSPDELWRAETSWWAAVETAALPLAVRPRPEVSAGVGVAALLAVDAWRVRAALTLAGHGGGDLAEVLHEVA